MQGILNCNADCFTKCDRNMHSKKNVLPNIISFIENLLVNPEYTHFKLLLCIVLSSNNYFQMCHMET